jgi:integral membrane sensor domain MASE1
MASNAAAQQEPANPRASWLMLAVCVAYTLVASGAMLLADARGYTSPLHPSAGIALAAAMVFGRAVLPGLFAGAVLANLGVAWGQAQTGWALFPLPLVLAFGTTLQAWLGAALVHRFVQQPLVLQVPRDIIKAGVLGALLACVVSASVATAALWWIAALPAASLPAAWLTWWVGDTLGVLIGGPAGADADWPARAPTGGRAGARWACPWCWPPWRC